ncbi:hypothetical protein PVK06_000754 [Gossypium arboreum]|uniref:Aminotransferase-like plant mobile domain-containing protein n=1 Tax=Gossypium arboreum TaxID=29729 RepID=A0ABR0QZ83_GOSAR|nr:hypothetical protein PVK06_000754 [Gossypium arboreum]
MASTFQSINCKWWNHEPSYVGLLEELQNIRLLLDQRLKVDFEWTSYFYLRIQKCILSEFLMNPNIWHVKVPLVVYATEEMHKSNRVKRQFGFR